MAEAGNGEGLPIKIRLSLETKSIDEGIGDFDAIYHAQEQGFLNSKGVKSMVRRAARRGSVGHQIMTRIAKAIGRLFGPKSEAYAHEIISQSRGKILENLGAWLMARKMCDGEYPRTSEIFNHLGWKDYEIAGPSELRDGHYAMQDWQETLCLNRNLINIENKIVLALGDAACRNFHIRSRRVKDFADVELIRGFVTELAEPPAEVQG